MSFTCLPFVIAFSIAISRHDCEGNPMTYAIANLVFSVLGCCVPPNAAIPISGIVNTVFFALGWVWFTEYTHGYNIIQYASTFGTDQWLTLPLTVQLMYFITWADLVGFCIGGVVLACFILFCGCSSIFSLFCCGSSMDVKPSAPPPAPLTAILTEPAATEPFQTAS